MRYSILLAALTLTSAAASLPIAGTTLTGPLEWGRNTLAGAMNNGSTENDSLAVGFTAPGGPGNSFTDLGFTVVANLDWGGSPDFSLYDDGDNAGYPVNRLATITVDDLTHWTVLSRQFP